MLMCRCVVVLASPRNLIIQSSPQVRTLLARNRIAQCHGCVAVAVTAAAVVSKATAARVNHTGETSNSRTHIQNMNVYIYTYIVYTWYTCIRKIHTCCGGAVRGGRKSTKPNWCLTNARRRQQPAARSLPNPEIKQSAHKLYIPDSNIASPSLSCGAAFVKTFKFGLVWLR